MREVIFNAPTFIGACSTDQERIITTCQSLKGQDPRNRWHPATKHLPPHPPLAIPITFSTVDLGPGGLKAIIWFMRLCLDQIVWEPQNKPLRLHDQRVNATPSSAITTTQYLGLNQGVHCPLLADWVTTNENWSHQFDSPQFPLKSWRVMVQETKAEIQVLVMTI